MTLLRTVFAAALLATSLSAMAGDPYSSARGQNAPMAEVEETVTLDDGREVTRTVKRKAEADSYGNAAGNQYDLVVDGAFEGQTVAVLHFYTGEGFDFSLPRDAIQQKGFSVYRWSNTAPSPDELRKGLAKANQLWIISDSSRHLNDEHLKIIKGFFDEGHGVYIWGDNDPYYADANAVADTLFGGSMSGNLPGQHVVGLASADSSNKGKLTRGHDITTGLEHLYEGITIATLAKHKDLEPLVVGSAGNLVTATYDKGGKRAVLDGGFTRLYLHWDTAGTARYVKNAASWLANYEKHGDAILADEIKTR